MLTIINYNHKKRIHNETLLNNYLHGISSQFNFDFQRINHQTVNVSISKTSVKLMQSCAQNHYENNFFFACLYDELTQNK